MPLWRETGHESKAAQIAEVRTLIQHLSPHFEEMEPKERQFIEGLDDRLNRFGEETVVTVKMLGWLRDLNMKY